MAALTQPFPALFLSSKIIRLSSPAQQSFKCYFIFYSFCRLEPTGSKEFCRNYEETCQVNKKRQNVKILKIECTEVFSLFHISYITDKLIFYIWGTELILRSEK